MAIRFGSVCSGIEAASVAWRPLGWKAAWLSEIEPFPSAVLAHHYPDVPNLGDMTKLPDRIVSGEIEAPDMLCGGTPCQAFSVAGLRKSLDDARGNLSLKFCEIANAIDAIRVARGEQPCIVFWENVHGVLSTKDNAFGCFLAALVGGDEPLDAPNGWPNAGCVSGPARTAAWRVLDAQYFGVAQRRKRVFVVASAREGLDPASVLLEFDGVRRDSAPSRETGQAASSRTGASTAERSWPAEVSSTLDTTFGTKQGLEDQHVNAGCPLFVPATTHTLRGEGFDASEDGAGRGTPLVPAAFAENSRHEIRLEGGGGRAQERNVLTPAMQVRRLTPRECEALQGFPADYTAIPWRKKPASECPDGPRYKALGNSWAVPVVAWIGRRIDAALKGAAC